MFNSKTLLVVGAGASKEVGLPLGTELANRISELLYFEFEHLGGLKKGNYQFVDNLKRYFGSNAILNSHLKAARQISEGIYLASSIDNYIDTHQDNEFIPVCGKTAIVHTILNAEKESQLYLNGTPDKRLNLKGLANTWYIKFAKLLFEQVPLKNLDKVFDNITIICFNYDRCIEHFFVSALSSLYSISKEKAESLVKKLKIIRPYGSVGDIFGIGDQQINFGMSTDYLNIVDLSKKIKTYTEQIEDENVLREIKNHVSLADTIIFLGFAFHSQNLRLLKPTKHVKVKKVYATAKGFSKPDTEVIEKQIRVMLGKSSDDPGPEISRTNKINIYIRNDLTCSDIFSEYQKSIPA